MAKSDQRSASRERWEQRRLPYPVRIETARSRTGRRSEQTAAILAQQRSQTILQEPHDTKLPDRSDRPLPVFLPTEWLQTFRVFLMSGRQGGTTASVAKSTV